MSFTKGEAVNQRQKNYLMIAKLNTKTLHDTEFYSRKLEMHVVEGDTILTPFRSIGAITFSHQLNTFPLVKSQLPCTLLISCAVSSLFQIFKLLILPFKRSTNSPDPSLRAPSTKVPPPLRPLSGVEMHHVITVFQPHNA